MSRIISDSSIWQDRDAFSEFYSSDTKLRFGLIREIDFDETRQEMIYIVEVSDEGDRHVISCRKMENIGGVYNYEEYRGQTYKADKTKDVVPAFTEKPGDAVIVAYLNGDAREGIILGGMKHPARKFELNIDDGPQYVRQINGVHEFINKDGEVRLTFKGQPINAEEALTKAPDGEDVPEPEFDEEIGGSYWEFDKTGSYTLTDVAQELPQSMFMDKPNGKIVVTSGEIVLTMEKESETTSLKTKITNITSDDEINIQTTKWDSNASDLTKHQTNKYEIRMSDWDVIARSTVKIKTPKVAIGSDAVELLQQISDQLQALAEAWLSASQERHLGNLGYPTEIPLNTGDYVKANAKMLEIKGKIDSIKGSL